MSLTTALILGPIIAAVIIYFALNGFKLKSGRQKQHETQGLPAQEIELFYPDAEFINKHCIDLETFIINDEINAHDLRRLADLNGIKLQIAAAWYPLTIELIKELHANGWDKKVSCIKEKYAALTVYINTDFGSTLHHIIDKYQEKSKHICETCGEKGEIRYGGWENVACRKHYLEGRGHITTEEAGFRHNGTFYTWEKIQDACFEDPAIDGKFRFLTITFSDKQKLLVSSAAIGFGRFLPQLPGSLPGLDYGYIQNNFTTVVYCEICGYQSVYGEECECCENDSWPGYITKWKQDNNDEARLDYLKYQQIFWMADDGELYEQQQNNYPKNPNHQILFTEEELKEYAEEDD